MRFTAASSRICWTNQMTNALRGPARMERNGRAPHPERVSPVAPAQKWDRRDGFRCQIENSVRYRWALNVDRWRLGYSMTVDGMVIAIRIANLCAMGWWSRSSSQIHPSSAHRDGPICPGGRSVGLNDPATIGYDSRMEETQISQRSVVAFAKLLSLVCARRALSRMGHRQKAA